MKTRVPRRSTQYVQLLLQWTLLGAAVGVAAGAGSALFLWLLEAATQYRLAHPWMVYWLPLAGACVGWAYDRYGKPIQGGNNLVIDTLHATGPELPLRMAPMVLFGTVLTHLFGGSAGREGTAVQMGASLSDWLSHRLKLGTALRRQLLAAGVAGGFGSVFGTPIAGALFGLEFVVLGRIEYHALWPALIAALVGDATTRAFGIEHSTFAGGPELPLTTLVLAKWFVFAAAVALVTTLFIELTQLLKRAGQRWIPRLPWRMAAGGLCVVLLWILSGTDDYLGLGVPFIQRAFTDPELPVWSWLFKLAFTALTLGAGFLGGEVTPLFFIGATLGNVLGRALGLPLELAAGVGLSAVFAAASNTPIALSVMALELLGARVFPHVVIVNVLAYVMTGHRSIYPSQRVLLRKGGDPVGQDLPLRDLGQETHQDTTEPSQPSGASESAHDITKP